MLVRGMVDDELGNDFKVSSMGLVQEVAKIPQITIVGVNREVICDIVTVVLER